MSRDEGRIYYAAHKGCYVFKLVGNVSQNTLQNQFDAINLADFIEKRFDAEQVDKVLIDLTEAHYIDSTHLGLLTQIAMAVRRNKGEAPYLWLRLRGKYGVFLWKWGCRRFFMSFQRQMSLFVPIRLYRQGTSPCRAIMRELYWKRIVRLLR